jgi:hypothetical protein
MYYFKAIIELEEFKDYILLNLGKEISFGNMEFYYNLDKDNNLKIWQVDLDEFGFPFPIFKGCFSTNIYSIIKDWKDNNSL